MQKETETWSSPLNVATHQHGTPRRKRVNESRRSGSKSPRFRVRKSPLKSRKQLKMRADDGYDEEGDGWPIDDRLREEMQVEKLNHPWSSDWARDEEKLFEIMFLRQELPILPHHWEVDFRGVPISDTSFNRDDGMKPIVYAHLKEFRATMALTRLIDLTANVRTTCQSGLRRKAPKMIKKGLDSYLNWAAEDGGFSHLTAVPNIVAEVIDPRGQREHIPTIIESRMKEVARRQRQFLQYDPDESKEEPSLSGGGESQQASRSLVGTTKNSWRNLPVRLISRLFSLIDIRPAIKRESAELESGVSRAGTPAIKIEEDTSLHLNNTKSHTGSERSTSVKDEEIKEEDVDMADIPAAQSPPKRPTSKSSEMSQEEPQSPLSSLRKPPVVYGLFIINTSVFILTADAAKAESVGQASFHVEVEFQEHRQSVWNALTIAMVVCQARDEMMTRLQDFEEKETVEDSDPDL